MDQMINLFRVNQEDAERIRSSANPPHWHSDYEELILGFSGSINHFIDSEIQQLQAPFVVFVSKKKTHRIEPILGPEDCLLFVIRFKSELLSESLFRLYTSYHGYANLVWKSQAKVGKLKVLVEVLAEELSAEQVDLGICRSLLQTIFDFIERERKLVYPELKTELTGHNQSFGQFLRLLEEGYKRPLGVEDYASQLFMSSRNLNIICRQLMQQSAGELIENRKLMEADNLLLNTELSIAEIACELGYSEPAYFSKVFKRKKGQKPLEYRKEMRKLLS